MLTIAQKFWGSDPQNCLPSGVEKRDKRMNIFQRGLLGEVVHDHFSQRCKIRMEQNMPRDIGYLSAGKQDLVGVCMRMALVEAMYKEEKPFLIFDDPFVNLDDNNIKGAMKLLDEIAKNYQVIYFTCSESRIHN